MSGKVKGILAVIVLMGIGLGARWMIHDDSAVQESSLSEEETEKKKKINAKKSMILQIVRLKNLNKK